MFVMNFFGVPGAGKSTGVAYVFSNLRMQGVSTELVTEFIKDMIWENYRREFVTFFILKEVVGMKKLRKKYLFKFVNIRNKSKARLIDNSGQGSIETA